MIRFLDAKSINYQTKFIITSIYDVKGEKAHPIFQWLQSDFSESPKWNFYKYLFDNKGNFLESWSSITKPNSKSIKQKVIQSLE